MSGQDGWEGLHNFRDLGGYRTRDGQTVRRGRLYRSDSLSKLRGSDLPRFRALGARTVIDLRYPFEIAARGRVHDGPHTYHNLSIEHRPYDQPALGPDVDPARYLADRYAAVLADGVAERVPPPGTWSQPGTPTIRAARCTGRVTRRHHRS